MRKFLYWLNFILLTIFPYTWDYLSQIGVFNYVSSQVLMIFSFIWGAISMNFMLARLPFFEKAKVRYAFIGASLTFAIMVGLMVIYSVG